MKRGLYPAVGLAIIAWIALPGCRGYSHHFAMPPGAEDVETVAIEIFKNKTLYTDVEFQFATALQREISAKTRLRIATRGKADAVITGSIDSYKHSVLREFDEDDNDEVARYSCVLEVSYEFTRLPSRGRPAKVISSGRNVRRSAEYEVASNISETDARAEAMWKMARKVVSHIFETW